jgi:hypothetical protein
MTDAYQTSKNGGDEVRHLTRAFALGALGRGKEIEQFLGGIQRDGRHGIRWLTLSPGRDGITVYLDEVEDVGTDTFWDIANFPPLNGQDEPWGKVITVVPTPEEALDLAERDFGARSDRWVNQDVVGDEYGDYRTARGPQHPPNL